MKKAENIVEKLAKQFYNGETLDLDKLKKSISKAMKIEFNRGVKFGRKIK